MALSFEQFSGDGTNSQFPIDFGYLSRDHISVSVDGVAVDFTFLSSGLIQTAVAPAAGTVVEVRRSTPRETPLTDFVDGSTLTEADLDTATLQTFYLAQEAYDIAGGTLGIQPDGSYSANNRRIGTVADPAGPQDVVNKRYFEATFLPQMVTNLGLSITARDTTLTYRDTAKGYRDEVFSWNVNVNAKSANVDAKAANVDAKNDNVNAKSASVDAKSTNVDAKAAAVDTHAGQVATDRTAVIGLRNEAETFKNQAAASAAAAATFDPSSYVPKTGGEYSGPVTTPRLSTKGSSGAVRIADRSNGTYWELSANNGTLEFNYFDGTTLTKRGHLTGAGLLQATDVGVL